MGREEQGKGRETKSNGREEERVIQIIREGEEWNKKEKIGKIEREKEN